MNHFTARGRGFIRAMIVRQLAGSSSGEVAADLARARYGAALGPFVAKAAVGPITGGDLDESAEEFLELAVEASILSRLNLRRVPFGVRMISIRTAPWATGLAKRRRSL